MQGAGTSPPHSCCHVGKVGVNGPSGPVLVSPLAVIAPLLLLLLLVEKEGEATKWQVKGGLPGEALFSLEKAGDADVPEYPHSFHLCFRN